MKTGYLQMNKSGRYELLDSDGNYLTYFTSGDPIEINLKDEIGDRWLKGRVEYSDSYGGYYFYNPNGSHVKLKNGVIARTE